MCRDLVVYDTPKHNLFRELIPMALKHPILLQTIVANSALHMSNVTQRSSRSSSMVTETASTPSTTSSPGPSSIASCGTASIEYYHDALRAKQQALLLLRSALENLASVDIDVVLAVVFLLLGFELIDSGRDNWRSHVDGARTIIDKMVLSAPVMATAWSPLRTWLVSNCLV